MNADTKTDQFGRELTACKLCSQPTPMLGTQLCDRCWELETRIKRDPEIARRVLHAVTWLETGKAVEGELTAVQAELTTSRLALSQQRAQAQAELDQVNEELAGVKAELAVTFGWWKEASDELLRTRDSNKLCQQVLSECERDLRELERYLKGSGAPADVVKLAGLAVENARAALEKVRTL